jgi:hypothetical protein
LRTFLKTWGDRKTARGQYSRVALSVDGRDPAGVAMILMRRLIVTGKMKKILNIESTMEMIALGMAICSEVGFFFRVFEAF